MGRRLSENVKKKMTYSGIMVLIIMVALYVIIRLIQPDADGQWIQMIFAALIEAILTVIITYLTISRNKRFILVVLGVISLCSGTMVLAYKFLPEYFPPIPIVHTTGPTPSPSPLPSPEKGVPDSAARLSEPQTQDTPPPRNPIEIDRVAAAKEEIKKKLLVEPEYTITNFKEYNNALETANGIEHKLSINSAATVGDVISLQKARNNVLGYTSDRTSYFLYANSFVMEADKQSIPVKKEECYSNAVKYFGQALDSAPLAPDAGSRAGFLRNYANACYNLAASKKNDDVENLCFIISLYEISVDYETMYASCLGAAQLYVKLGILRDDADSYKCYLNAEAMLNKFTNGQFSSNHEGMLNCYKDIYAKLQKFIEENGRLGPMLDLATYSSKHSAVQKAFDKAAKSSTAPVSELK